MFGVNNSVVNLLVFVLCSSLSLHVVVANFVDDMTNIFDDEPLDNSNFEDMTLIDIHES